MTAKILVVDDSITIQKIVAMAFEKEDALVEGIGNGSEALVKLKKSRPDIVLADVNMPGLNGFELSKKIKESREFDSVSVLLLTSDFEEFDKDHFRASLADDHITKPFKSDDIVRKVMDLLKEKKRSGPVENDETEQVIALSKNDRVDEETVLELGKDQLMNSMEEFPPEEEEVHLELSNHDLVTPGDHSEQEGLLLDLEEEEVSGHNPAMDHPIFKVDEEDAEAPARSGNRVQGESLEELIRKVDKLTKKSEDFHEQESSEGVLSQNTLDEMIKEVNALRKVSSPANKEGNGNGQVPVESNESDTLIAEVNYTNEENADELEAAFQKILHANRSNSSTLTTVPPEEPPTPREGEEIVPDPEPSLEDLANHPFATSFENPEPGPEVETQSHISEEPPASEADNMQAEEGYENISEFQSSQEELFCQLMGKEVREIMEQSLTSSMEKEISGLSEKIMKSVEEIVREIVPGIAKKMIDEEIQRIKTKGKN